jgi:hypothetical protein
MHYITWCITHPFKTILGVFVWLLLASGLSIGALSVVGMSQSFAHYILWLLPFAIPTLLINILALTLFYRALRGRGNWYHVFLFFPCALLINLFFFLAFLFVTFSVFGFS